jgi:hypothetical protein
MATESSIKVISKSSSSITFELTLSKAFNQSNGYIEAGIVMVDADEKFMHESNELTGSREIAMSAPSSGTNTIVSLTVTGLNPDTTYYFYGRSTCDGVYGDWSSVNIVRTNCYETLPLPYFDNFDNQVAVGQSPDCWDSYYQEDNVAYPALDAMSSALTTGIYPHSGQRAVYLRTETSAPSYLVSKEIEVDNLNKCQVSFFALPKNAGMNNSLVVGVVEDVDSIASSFVAIDTIFINQGIRVWEEIVVSFAGYTGTSKRIAFVSYHSLNEGSSRESGVYVDDVHEKLGRSRWCVGNRKHSAELDVVTTCSPRSLN